jgi:hypothetical protein
MAEYQSIVPKDPYANLNLQGFPTNTSIGLVLSMNYLRPAENPVPFAPFPKLTPLLDTTRIQTLTEYIGGAPLPPTERSVVTLRSFV